MWGWWFGDQASQCKWNGLYVADSCQQSLACFRRTFTSYISREEVGYFLHDWDRFCRAIPVLQLPASTQAGASGICEVFRILGYGMLN